VKAVTFRSRALLLKRPSGWKLLTAGNRIVFLIAGALIVLTSFIAKDALRERYADLTEKIASAKTTAALYKGVSDTNFRLLEIQRELTAMDEGLNQPRFNVYAEQYFRSAHARMDSESSENFSDAVHNLRGLLQVLHDDKNPKLLKLEEVANALRSSAESKAEMSNNPSLLKNYLSDVFTDPAQHQKEALRVDTDEYGLSAFTDDVIAEAERQREHNEKLANLVTYCSYFLFALGWTLTFVGKVFRIDELVTDSE
jgi:hypothetical protein